MGQTKPYRGYTLHRGRSWQDWWVNLDGRVRWGTLDEIRSDVDLHIAGSLPPPKRGWA